MMKVVAVSFFVALMLTGCAAPQYIPLSDTAEKKIGQVSARAVVIQDEIIARADPSRVSVALGGGLLPALIDASITKGRQDRLQSAMESFYATIEDYDFRGDYFPQVTRQLQDGFPFKVTRVTATPRPLSLKEQQQVIAELAADEAYLALFTDYYMSTDLRSVNVSTMAQLWLKGTGGAHDLPVYKNRMTYQSTAQGTGGEQSLKLWASDNGKRFYEALREGMRENLAMLALDIKRTTPPAKPEKFTAKYNFGEGASANHQSIQGTLVERRGERYVIRDAAGHLYSLLP